MTGLTMAAMARPSARGRDPRVDALRGLCFVFMTVDHFPANPLLRISNSNFGLFGFFTAALGLCFSPGTSPGACTKRVGPDSASVR